MKEKFKELQQRLKKRLIKIKEGFVNLPKNTIIFLTNFVFGVRDAFASLPKYVVYSSKTMYAKIKNTPSDIVSFGKKIKNFKFADWKRVFLNNAILFSLLGLIIYIIIVNANFLQAKTFSDILTQSSTKLIIALGTGTIIVARGTDLSAGRVVGLTALVGATFSQEVAYKSAFVKEVLGYNGLLIILVTMLVGALVGLINGIIVAKFNVTPFIATLGTMLIVYGINIYYALSISNQQPIGIFDDQYTRIISQGIDIGHFKITYLTMISIFLAFFMWVIWTKMPYGRSLFAVGGNPKAAAVSGISVTFILISTYVIGGVLYGIGGALEAWRIGSVTSSTGTMYELDAIAACIVGGLSFDGGRGKISGIILGVFIFQTITYGFAFIGLQTHVIYIVKGLIIISAVSLDMLKNKVKI